MNASTATLSTHLRTTTRSAHDTAETTGFITRLMGGELNIDAYADLAAQQLPVYEALERASARLSEDERARTLIFDELTRTPSIREDLEFLFGADWEATIDILEEARVYAQRIDEINDLASYAAHAYTRYLGDLSGGQVIKRMMQRHYGMNDDGLTFYHFEEIPKPKPFKDIYRERLDGLGLTDEELVRAGEEAQLAFALNTSLFQALGARH